MNPIYNIKMWEDLISVLEYADLKTLDSPYLCDISNKFYNLWNNREQWEYLKIQAEEFLKNWDDKLGYWKVTQRHLFSKNNSLSMSHVSIYEKVPVRLAFCKYMLNKSKEYESQ